MAFKKLVLIVSNLVIVLAAVKPKANITKRQLLRTHANKALVWILLLPLASMYWYYTYRTFLKALQPTTTLNGVKILLFMTARIFSACLVVFQIFQCNYIQEKEWLKLVLFTTNPRNNTKEVIGYFRHLLLLAYLSVAVWNVSYVSTLEGRSVILRIIMTWFNIRTAVDVTIMQATLYKVVFELKEIEANIKDAINMKKLYLIQTGINTISWNLRMKYLRICHLVEAFNSVYGWRIFCYSGSCFFYAVAVLSYLDTVQGNSWIYVLFDGLGILTITVASDMVSGTADNLLLNVSEIIELFPKKSSQSKELSRLANLLHQHPLTVTAANFFCLNRTTLFGFTSAITTYFIAIIQFR